VLLSTRGGVLSTRTMRLVRPEQFGGPGFVPFLFPGFRFASEATDVVRMTDVHGVERPWRCNLYTSWGIFPAGSLVPRDHPRLGSFAAITAARARSGVRLHSPRLVKTANVMAINGHD